LRFDVFKPKMLVLFIKTRAKFALTNNERLNPLSVNAHQPRSQPSADHRSAACDAGLNL
jgi:hypothetical protein